MSQKSPKTAVVAFKVEEELAEFINKLPNKSSFIRQAIAAQLGMACPLCHGKGIVPRGAHDHYAGLMKEFSHRHCDGCGDDLPLPQQDSGILGPEDQARLEQFLRGGPLFCDGCYEKAPPCADCGWHIPPDGLAEHLRQAHHD